MAESDLEKGAEFSQFFKGHDGEEDPVIVAQRYLNIFRQLHIFTAAKRKEFDAELLKLPPNIRGSFVNLPGGSLLQDYVYDLEDKAGIAHAKPSASVRSARMEEEAAPQVAAAAVSDSSLEDIKKLLQADIASRGKMSAATPIAMPAGGEVKLTIDSGIKDELMGSLAKLLEENRLAQQKNSQSLAQILSESQAKIAEILAQRPAVDSPALSESLAHILEANKDGISLNAGISGAESQKLIDEIIEKQSNLFMEFSERQSMQLGSVLSSALQETNQASAKMIMDALSAFQKENTRLINMQEKIQRAILENEKRSSAPYSGFTLSAGNVSLNRDSSIESPVSSFGFNTGLMGFGSQPSTSSASTSAPANNSLIGESAPQPVKNPTQEEDKSAAKKAEDNFERLESLLSDADSLFSSDNETSSKKKKKNKKKKNKDKPKENNDDIIVLYDDDLKESNNSAKLEVQAAEVSKDNEVAPSDDENLGVYQPVPEQQEWEYHPVAETDSNNHQEWKYSEDTAPQSDEQAWEYVNEEGSPAEEEPQWEYATEDGTPSSNDEEWEYATEDGAPANGEKWEYVNEDGTPTDGEEWEYVTEDGTPADGEEWEYVTEDGTPADGEEWEYVTEDGTPADGEEWEYVTEDGAPADGEEWEYVTEDGAPVDNTADIALSEESHNLNQDDVAGNYEAPREAPAVAEANEASAGETDSLSQPEDNDILFTDTSADEPYSAPNHGFSTTENLEEQTSQSTMPTDVFNPLYGEQIQLDTSNQPQAAGALDLSGLKLYEVSEFDNAADEPYGNVKQ